MELGQMSAESKSSSKPVSTTALEAKVQAYWSKERVKQLTGGKPWLFMPDQDWLLLHALGLMDAQGLINHERLRKLSQINHMVQLLKQSLEDLCQRHSVVRIVDGACGTSALTLALAWLLNKRWQHPVSIIGIDSNPKVIETSSKRAGQLGLEGCTQWIHGSIQESIENLDFTKGIANPFMSKELSSGAVTSPTPSGGMQRPHLLIALHACDKASDQALWFGLHHKADVIAIAPCCHRELATFWKQNSLKWTHNPLRLVMNAPQLRHETASHLTDALRVGYMRASGYEVSTTEFVPSDHTPKNRLIMCHRRGRYHTPSQRDFQNLKETLGSPVLELERLNQDHTAELSELQVEQIRH